MIHGHKPSAYFSTFDGEGKKIEGECRQCIHCQYTWQYAPGSGDRRGYCLKCGGYICARAECHRDQEIRIAEWFSQNGSVRFCYPFEEWNSRIQDKVRKLLPLEPGLTLTPDGLVVPAR